jgi:hypothetical protein
VVLPFSKAPIPDPDFPANTNQPFYKQGARGFVGLAGESRLTDANTPFFHVQVNAGATTVLNVNDAGQGVFATAASPPAGVRPLRPNSRPVFRPDVPCETQETPDLNAPGGPPDRFVTQTLPGGLLPPLNIPPLPGQPSNAKLAAMGTRQVNELKDYLARKRAGKPAVDPIATTHANYVLQMKKIGLRVTKQGKVLPMAGGAR